MKYQIERTARFRREYRLAKRRGQDIERLHKVIALLANGEQLPTEYRDHSLSGVYVGCRECHIAADWLLVYQIVERELILVLLRLGTHADLFE